MSSLLYCWDDFDPWQNQDNISLFDIEKFEQEQYELFNQRLQDEVVI